MQATGLRLAIMVLLMIFGPRAASGAEGTEIRDPFPGTQYGSLAHDRPGAGRLTAAIGPTGTGNEESLATVSDDPAAEALLGDRIAADKAARFASDTGRENLHAGAKDAPASGVPGPLVMILLGSGLIGLAEWGRRKRGKSSLST